MHDRTLTVTIRRRYDASPEAVFRAFSEAALLTRWFSPSADIALEVFEHHPRPGGCYRFVYRFPDGERRTVRGEFREVQAPGRLVFTWTWEPPDPHAGIVTLVTVELAADGAGTALLITHEMLPDHDTRDRHADGWRATLDRLPEALA